MNPSIAPFPAPTPRERFARAVAEAAGTLWDALAQGAEKGEILTPAEAAKELSVSAAHITNLCQRGAIRAFRVGRLWRISRSELEKYKRR